MKNRTMPRAAGECKTCCGHLPQIMQPDGRRHEYIIACPICGNRTRAAYREEWTAAQAWDCRETTHAQRTGNIEEQLHF